MNPFGQAGNLKFPALLPAPPSFLASVLLPLLLSLIWGRGLRRRFRKTVSAMNQMKYDFEARFERTAWRFASSESQTASILAEAIRLSCRVISIKSLQSKRLDPNVYLLL